MALSTDTSVSFTSATGYTVYEPSPGDIVFSGGTAFLDAGLEDDDFPYAAIRTPQIDISGWNAVLKSVPSITEVVGYEHSFLVSFEDWSDDAVRQRWYYYAAGAGWIPVANGNASLSALLNALEAFGMGGKTLAAINEWPEISGNIRLSFLVGLKRETGGGTGAITLITVTYGTEIVAILPPASNVGTLAFEPERHAPAFRQVFDTVPFDGYQQMVEEDTKSRRSMPLRWTVLSEADKDTLVAFLNSAMGPDYFTWLAYGDSAARKWQVLGDPVIEQDGIKTLYNVSANVQEYLGP